MKTRCAFGLALLCLVAALATAPGAPLAAHTAPAPTIGPASIMTGVSECFPVDECNICCPLGGGKLVCTQRACV